MISAVYMYVWASSWSGCNQGAVQSDHMRLMLTETLPHKTCQNRGLHQIHAAPLASAPWRAAHVGEWRAVAGACTIGEQVASEWSEQATCRGYYSWCTDLLLYCSLLHFWFLIFEYLSGPTFKEDGPSFEWDGPIFGSEGSRKYAHPPLWAAT